MDIKKIAKLIGIGAGGLIIIGGLLAGITGYWPIAIVDRTPITYNTFKENFTMANHFYRSNLKLSGDGDGAVMTIDAQRDLQRVTMEGLIEQILIDHELAKKYKAADMKQLIENKISGVNVDSEEMKKATELLYGLTAEQFKEIILIPKAKQEILEGNLTLQNGTFNDWMIAKKKEVNVSVFIPALYWENGEVKIN